MAAAHQPSRRNVAGYEGWILSSEAAGGIDATFVPQAGMVCCSLRHRGRELLGQRGGLARYVAERGTMGIPLLHPFANRLARRSFTLAGRPVDLDRATSLLHLDPNGLPIHGLLAGHPGWEVRAQEEPGHGGCGLAASFDFASDGRLTAAFPFAHRLELEVTLRDSTLEIATTLEANAGVPVPVSFGYHPYFTLPGVTRDAWEVRLPVSRRLVVDDRMIPTGASEAATGVEAGPLGTRTFDDGYAELEPGARFVLAGGGRRIEVRFEEGYPATVIYAPGDDGVICFEPMTAPTDALVSGDGLRWVAPGARFTARFSVVVIDEETLSAPGDPPKHRGDDPIN